MAKAKKAEAEKKTGGWTSI